MHNIINVKEYSKDIDIAIKYIHNIWGSKSNYPFYNDAILHSSEEGKPLPRFYLILDNEKIIGCYALLTNDLISRQDLYPWFGCLFIEKEYRGKQLGFELMKHGIIETKNLNFSALYLTTDHNGYYEKYGWIRIEDGFEFNGDRTKIYKIDITSEK